MEQIKSTLTGGELTIFISGKIDSSNAKKLEAEIFDICNAGTYESIVLDVDELQYISSAGLRVILRLRKENPLLKIINCSSEVYEIFDMTGFTEMMTIEKGYRKISIDGCEVIGEGANGIVYRIDPDTIVKYYKNKNALPEIHNERELARKAFVLGIPTAIPYDVVKCGDSYGSVFELLNAASFLKLIKADPDKIDEYVALSVEVLKKIHATKVKEGDMPDQREIAIGWGDLIYDKLKPEKAAKLKALLEGVPKDDHMIHGDYHVKNIMMQDGEVLLIDMDTLCHGNPVYEFSAIYNAYVGFGEIDQENITKFLGISIETANHIFDKTIELYFDDRSAEEIETIKNRLKVLSYLRMARRIIKRGGHRPSYEYYMAQLNDLLDKVDELAI